MLARGRTRVKLNPLWLRQAVRWLPALVVMGAIFYLSQRSAPPVATTDSTRAVVAHLVLYAGLALALYWPLSARKHAATWLPAALSFALAVLYGVTDELHQAFVPQRVASEVDLGVDAVGGLIGVAVAFVVATLFKGPR